jgi:hypothetical protein
MHSPAIIFTLLSAFVHAGLAATDTYRVYAVPKGPLTTIRTQLSFVNCTPPPLLFFPSTNHH